MKTKPVHTDDKNYRRISMSKQSHGKDKKRQTDFSVLIAQRKQLTKAPKPPKTFNKHQIKKFKELCDNLIELNSLAESEVHIVELAAFALGSCIALQSDFNDLIKQKDYDEGKKVQTMLTTMMSNARSALQELGLTPAKRMKLLALAEKENKKESDDKSFDFYE